MAKKALVLLNFGGPRSMEEVERFLTDLFSDPFVFQYPAFFRKLLSFFLVKRNLNRVKKNYQKLGGKSPLYENTQNQAKALQKELGDDYKVFCAMRYGRPSTSDIITEIKTLSFDSVFLLPLYPHFSIATTRSSFFAWQKEAKEKDFSVPTQKICCYPTKDFFIQAHIETIKEVLDKVDDNFRLLFSAHGIPEKFVRQGDPYVDQLEKTVKAIALGLEKETGKKIDTILTYQSRVGPMKWTTPYLDDTLEETAKKKKGVVVVPIAFVSEHSETLLELDEEYQEKAENLGIPFFKRVPALGTNKTFIKGLSKIVLSKAQGTGCPIDFLKCWMHEHSIFL